MSTPKSKFANLVGQIAQPEPEAAPERVEKVSSPTEVTPPAIEPRTAMTYRPRVVTHERLRKISFETRRSMQELVDEAVEAWLADR
ncbi:hypothetical protein [Paracraurococcus lichenis]|uniref:Uncharacterized protein n=1 Tax=Paracraurococcus lichenis TaxID=3064888 RepID=A0ABT9E8N2_9PROT|nr:hypothetical protein [Paracraurococcus sp. LOR1-02]MDO9712482.1 hypothetical protein [Paracraurococcus sp. LOR1-02]